MPNTDMQGFALRLSTEEHTALKTYASVTGKSANDVIREALRTHLTGPGRREEFDAILKEVTTNYAVALDKLADT